MPTELWDVGSWPSPSGEAAVRARVRRRARGILRMRAAMAAVAVVLAAVAVTSDGPGRESGVRMRHDVNWNGADQPAVVGDGTTGIDGRLGGTGVSPATAEGPVPSQNGSGAAQAPTSAPAVSAPSGPTVVDQIGDGQYKAGCETNTCPREARVESSASNDMFDFRSVSALCSQSSLLARFDLVDLDATPGPNNVGLSPVSATYQLTMYFDWPLQLSMSVVKHFDTGVLWAGGVISFDAGDDHFSAFFTPTTRQEGDSYVAEIDWATLSAAFEEARPGTKPPSVGTAFDPRGYANATFQSSPLTRFGQNSDQVQSATPQRFCLP